MSEPSDKVIEYAPRQKFHLSRRTKQLVLIATALLTMCLLLPSANRQLQRKLLISRFASYVMPSDLPAMDATTANRTVAYSTTVSPPVPVEFDIILAPEGIATLYIGQLRDSAGIDYLVRIELSKSWERYTFRAATVPKSNDTSPPVRSGECSIPDYVWSTSTRIQVFAAQQDPNRADHITIRCLINNGTRIIDGYLNDDGTMTLELREPPTTSAG